MFLTILLSVILPVTGQQDFDRLGERIDTLLLAGEREVEVRFAPGTYYFREGHLRLSGIEAPETIVRLKGDGAVLTGYEDGQGPTFSCGFVNRERREAIDVLGPVRKAGFWPLRVPFSEDLYVLRCKGLPNVSEVGAAGMKIVLSQWFVGAVYDVVKISRGWIFFRRVPYRTRIWSELRFGRCLPRFMLFSPGKAGSHYPCAASNFLSVENSRFGSIVLEGIHFLGNGEGDRLIRFCGVDADSVVVRGCTFEGIRSKGILVEQTDCFRLLDNAFLKGALNQVFVDKTADDARIEGNRFLENGLLMTNDPVLDCKGSHFLVRNNYFRDFSYSAIGAGLHFTDTAGLVTSGVIEKNEICMSEGYRQAPMRSLIDGGAIYVWTQNKDLTIRENYIHDIAGPHGNRGIFGDDGVVNLTVTDNTVLRVRGSYAIDVRRVYRIGRRKDSALRLVNYGVVIKDNTYDGRVRLHVRKNDPDSYLGGNTKLKNP